MLSSKAIEVKLQLNNNSFVAGIDAAIRKLKNFEDLQRKVTSGTTKMQESMNKTSSSVSTLNKNLSQMSDSTRQFTLFNSAVTGAGNALSNFWGIVKRYGTIAAGAGIAKVTKDYMDFGQQVAMLQTKMKNTPREKVEGLSRVLRDIAPQYNAKTSDIMGAATEIAASGIEDSEVILEIAKGAAIAKASNPSANIQTLAEGALSLLGQRRNDPKAAQEFFDAFLQQQDLGRFSAQENIMSLSSYAIAPFQAAGVDYRQVLAAYAGMTMHAGSASTAATQLGALASDIYQKPKVSEKLREKGIDVFPGDFIKTVSQIQEKLKGLKDEEIQTWLYDVGIRNKRALRGFIAMQEEGDNLLELYDKVLNSQGVAAENMQIASEETKYKMGQLFKEIQVGSMKVAESFDPMWQAVLDTFLSAENLDINLDEVGLQVKENLKKSLGKDSLWADVGGFLAKQVAGSARDIKDNPTAGISLTAGKIGLGVASGGALLGVLKNLFGGASSLATSNPIATALLLGMGKIAHEVGDSWGEGLETYFDEKSEGKNWMQSTSAGLARANKLNPINSMLDKVVSMYLTMTGVNPPVENTSGIDHGELSEEQLNWGKSLWRQESVGGENAWQDIGKGQEENAYLEKYRAFGEMMIEAGNIQVEKMETLNGGLENNTQAIDDNTKTFSSESQQLSGALSSLKVAVSNLAANGVPLTGSLGILNVNSNKPKGEGE